MSPSSTIKPPLHWLGIIHKLAHVHSWQFFLLAERLHPEIEQPRYGKLKLGPHYKHDHFHRLFFCLKWLNDDNFFRTWEVLSGWGKSSIHLDTCHVLQAIVEGLRYSGPMSVNTNWYDGIFHGYINFSIVKEFEIEKPGDPVMERKASVARKYCSF